MADDWDFYSLQVDDLTASIFVDLSLEHEAPVTGFPFMAYVRLYMISPRGDGLSSQEEFEILCNLEDALTQALANFSSIYVGRNTSDGCRDFIFYVATPENWSEQVAQALAGHAGYRYETGYREDATWSVYLDFLLPSPMDREKIENRRVCATLERMGDKLEAHREIDHWSYFPTREAADAFLAEVQQLGFQLRSFTSHESQEPAIGVQIWRNDIPSFSNIDKVTYPISLAATRHAGKYDGWECPVER
ncbi:DUF695 domain-containing protein [Chitinilyticum litopenaei]|uniref:DUF695 domain-containing protein n=1 Tax=Chitinilyticum litopenaei TaxID=1121276 RepID=UPI00048CCB96|nr:DUF695 domain-containing protein [Chitinilyticum litopenaei]